MFTLARKIDFSYMTNKVILAIAALAAFAGYLVTRDIKSGIYIGMGVFLTWAIAREVDPKHDYSAFACVTISLVNLFYYEKINLLVLFWIVLVLRMLNGITGKDLTLVDIISVLGLSIYMSINLKNSIYMVPFISAIMSLNKFDKKTKFTTAAFIVSLGIFLLESFYFKIFEFQVIDFSSKINIAVIAGSFLFSVWINFISIKDLKDDLGNPAEERRIRAAQMLFSNIVLLLLLFAGINLNNLIIYISIMLGIITYSFIDR
nr:hypothetical protein [Tissierella sp.]